MENEVVADEVFDDSQARVSRIMGLARDKALQMLEAAAVQRQSVVLVKGRAVTQNCSACDVVYEDLTDVLDQTTSGSQDAGR